MNKYEFVKAVAKAKGISRTSAYRPVNAVMMALLDGGEVEIGGFGTFAAVTDLKGVRIPVFKAGRALKSV